MYLLPTEREQRIKAAIKTFEETGSLFIFEPCNCGSQIRHNNGGNYHEEIYLKADQGVYVKHETTCELTPEAEWQIVDDWRAVITQNADWL